MGLIHRQERVGLGGRTFTMYKIETVRGGRVTRPFLRRTGLDELPQLWNVLRGDMALFGPRPEEPDLHAFYSRMVPGWEGRTRVKPGMIGVAQVAGTVRGRDRLSVERKREQARLDEEMIRGWGPATAAWILARLPGAMIRGQEA